MKRKDHLMMILEAQKDWITGKELATILNISDRTVRSDISSINEEMNTKLIESDTKRGYRLIRQDFQLPKKEKPVNS